MNKSIAVVLALAVGLTSVPPVSADRVTIPAGTHVIVKLTDAVSSATAKKGDQVPFTVESDVRVSNTTVIAQGAQATGTVINASKRFILGIGGQLDVRVEKAQAVDGTWVPLEYTQGEHNGSSLVSLILTYLCCCCFIFIPGKNVSIEKGAIFETTVTSPTDIMTPPSA